MPQNILGKIALGSAQFGLDYGINNKRGKIPKEEVFALLRLAASAGIKTLDTAYAYGKSEKVIGDFLTTHNKQFQVVSKLPPVNPEEVEDVFQRSLDRLNLGDIYGYLVHDFNWFKKNLGIWSILEKLKKQKKIKKIGFSLYYPDELEYLLSKNVRFDLIQVPYSILDRRFEKLLPELLSKNIEVHARSVFLQGLIFKSPDKLPGFFSEVKQKLIDLREYCAKKSLSLLEISLNFVLGNKFIDKVILGVDGINHLKEIIAAAKHFSRVKDFIPEFRKFSIADEKILVPSKWPTK